MILENQQDGWADLHVHTTWSDGVFSPQHLIQKAAEIGIRAIAVTDHDAVRGIKEAAQEGEMCGVEVLSGIELSTTNGIHDVHILGFLFDPEDPYILEYVDFFQKERQKRARKIMNRLREMGVRLNVEFVIANAGHGAVGRPHIADALMEEGYALTYDEAFYKYIGDGKPAFVEKPKITPSEGMQLIHRGGGLSFLAHPGMDLTEAEIMAIIKQGLDGIEILHPTHSEEKVNYFYKFARDNNLLVSGGSDCHGDRKGKMMMGKFNVPYRFVAEMKNAVKV